LDLKSIIREIQDFPREGINYKDVSTLLLNGPAYRQAIQELAAQCMHKHADLIVCPKARGLMIGAPLAYILGTGLLTLSIPSQPEDIFSWHHDPEFGDRPAQMDRDIIEPEMKVLVVDELIATGGTVAKTVRMIEELGAEVVGTVFLIELTGLGGRVKIQDYDTISLVQYNY